MKDYIEEIDYKGYEIAVTYSEYSDSPRNWDNLGKLFLQHGRYSLAWEDKDIDKNLSLDELEKELKKQGYKNIMVVYGYDHSGLALSLGGFSCQWDSGILGLIATKVKDKKEFGVRTEKQVKEIYQQELELYQKYLNGEVYEVGIYQEKTCKCCGETKTDCIGNHVGFYDTDDAIEYAKSEVDYLVESETKND